MLRYKSSEYQDALARRKRSSQPRRQVKRNERADKESAGKVGEKQVRGMIRPSAASHMPLVLVLCG